MLLWFIYVRCWRLSCVLVAVYSCKYSFTTWAHHGLFCRGYSILYAKLHSELCSSTNFHTKPKPAYHSNQLLYTLPYASIYCGQMWCIFDNLGLPLSGLLYNNLYAKNGPGSWYIERGLRVFGLSSNKSLRSVCTRLSALIPDGALTSTWFRATKISGPDQNLA